MVSVFGLFSSSFSVPVLFPIHFSELVFLLRSTISEIHTWWPAIPEMTKRGLPATG